MYGDAVFGGLPGDHGEHQYRYLLWRCWDPWADQLTFVLCNPSLAGGLENGILIPDPTVNRLVEIALHNGAGGFVLINLIAHVEPALHSAKGRDLEGPDNPSHIEDVLRLSNKLVVGWGANKTTRKYRQGLLISIEGRPRWCVSVNSASLTPMHPLQRAAKRLELGECSTIS